jgi:hypothetical protein
MKGIQFGFAIGLGHDAESVNLVAAGEKADSRWGGELAFDPSLDSPRPEHLAQ